MSLSYPDPALLRHAALTAAARGWHVVPACPGTTTPALHGPRACPGTGDCRHGHQDWQRRATRDPRRIHTWWRHGLPYNVAIATGPSQLVVLDLQPPDTHVPSGTDELAHLAIAADEEPPWDTYTVTTSDGGRHLYFHAPNPPRTTTRLGLRLHARSHGGTVLATGSVLPRGQFAESRGQPIAALPHWLAALLPTVSHEPATHRAENSVTDPRIVHAT